jgi:small-conductance mechanosensitive channel
MTWHFVLPAGFLLLIITLYILTIKKTLFVKLKSILPFLYTLFFLSLALSALKSDFVTRFFYSRVLVIFLELVFIFFVLVLVVKLTIFFVFDFLFGKRQQIQYPRLIKDIVVIILYIIGISLIAKYYFNTELTVVLASSAVLTAVIGLALQDLLGDLFSGIALNFEESTKIGDWIKIAAYEGKIEQFRWRSIKLRTTDNVLILIPNRLASKEEVLRFGRADEPFALRFTIGVSYKSSPGQVSATLIEVMRTIPGILNTPTPVVMVKEYDDFAIVYEIRFWLTDYSTKDAIKSEIRRKTWYAFKRKDIQIPFPIRDVYIKDFKKEKASALPEAEGMTKEQIVEILHKNEVFNTLSQNQLEELAENIEIKLYGEGEMLIKEGEEGEYFYHFLAGGAEVLKHNRVVRRLEVDDFVGEISLFTGEKTVADVRITQESHILCLSSGKFRETLKLNEKMARKLAEVIALRKAQLQESKKEEEQEQSRLTAIKKESENIFLRIKKYFSF